jgi:chaperonin GroEL
MAVKNPAFGQFGHDVAGDLAAITGGQVFTRLDDVVKEKLGMARLVQISKSELVIADGAGTTAQVAARRGEIERNLNAAGTRTDYEREQLGQRLKTLDSKAAIICAGAADPSDTFCLANLAEDAVRVAQGALEEGVVSRDAALRSAAAALDSLALEPQERPGADLVRAALQNMERWSRSEAGVDSVTALCNALEMSGYIAGALLTDQAVLQAAATHLEKHPM